MTPQIANMLFGALMMYYAVGVLLIAACLLVEGMKMSWRLLALPLLVFVWPMYVWHMLLERNGRGRS